MRSRIASLALVTALFVAVNPAAPSERPIGAIERAPGTGDRRMATAERVPVPHRVHARSGPLARARSKLVAFETAPFPYKGAIPRTEKPFLDVNENGRLGHRTGSGRIYWEDETYSDRQVLLHIPKGFDIRRPSLLVVFFH